ncbi:MAG: hypothetical protein KDN22_26900 [Verrucomicrobiae bacterium]|nr:hypothetical protein [Verrucomicrobiae bacterium]
MRKTTLLLALTTAIGWGQAPGDLTGSLSGKHEDMPVAGSAAAQDSKPAPVEVVFRGRATLSGKIEQIKTHDDDGNAVFPLYLYTDKPIVVKPAVDFDPGDTNRELDGIEVKLLEGDAAGLERHRGKTVTVRGKVATGTGLHCHGFGLYVASLKDIEEHDKFGAGGQITTPERGSRLRKEICDAFRVPMMKKVNGQDIVFVIYTLNVFGDWAFIHCALQLANGEEIDWKKAGLLNDPDSDFVENDAAGLLRRDANGKWSVVEHSFNHTDVVWADWDEKHGIPEQLFK